MPGKNLLCMKNTLSSYIGSHFLKDFRQEMPFAPTGNLEFLRPLLHDFWIFLKKLRVDVENDWGVQLACISKAALRQNDISSINNITAIDSTGHYVSPLVGRSIGRSVDLFGVIRAVFATLPLPNRK